MAIIWKVVGIIVCLAIIYFGVGLMKGDVISKVLGAILVLVGVFGVLFLIGVPIG